MKRVLGPVLAVAIAVTAGATAEPIYSPLSIQGLGPLKFGYTADQMQRFLHDKMAYNPYANHGCSVFTTQELEPTGISFMVQQKILTRVNVDFYGNDPRPLEIKTDKGIGLRSTEDEVKAAYPNAVIKANPADPTWHTIVVDAPDHMSGMIFETDGKTVKSIRAGQYPAISQADGCN